MLVQRELLLNSVQQNWWGKEKTNHPLKAFVNHMNKKRVYCEVVGVGMGAWMVYQKWATDAHGQKVSDKKGYTDTSVYNWCVARAYHEVLQQHGNRYAQSIAAIEFSWMSEIRPYLQEMIRMSIADYNRRPAGIKLLFPSRKDPMQVTDTSEELTNNMLELTA